ncbi:MAG: hypothetical protein M1813_007382 [Trichoglossum hirsutum]|nr:MAG: hypothetical protein M1813_007382 [Trichoglossum hirsutum]
MKSIEAQAWADSGALADVAFNWMPGGQWQSAMDLFMEKNSVQDEYKGKVATGLQGERDAHRPNLIFPELVIQVYCGDNKEVGGKMDDKIMYPFATSWSLNRAYNDYYIVLCPRFFAEKDSLMHTLAKMDHGTINRNNTSAYKFTWGHTYYHELMHLDPVVAGEETWDAAYGACNVAKLAKANGCKTGPFPGAAYFQNAFNLKSPGQPDCTNRTDGTFNAASQPPAGSSESPAPDGPTLTFPFDVKAATPAGLATPYTDAVAYFSSLGYETHSTSSPTTR